MSFRRSLLAVAALVVCACGSPPPSAVDEEMLLVDIEACARGDAECQKSGAVFPVEFLVPGDHAVNLFAPIQCAEDVYCDPDTHQCCGTSPPTCTPKGDAKACTTPMPQPTPNPARISLPIRRPTPDARLAWIAIGLTAPSEFGRRAVVTLTGSEPVVIEPSRFASRVEVAAKEVVPPGDARLDLTVTNGSFTIAWIVGRWKR